MRTLCPMYSFAGDNATYDARAALLQPGDIAIVTSSLSGPDPYDPALLDQIRELKQRDILVFGYVHVMYGARPLGEVLEDITSWRTLYGVRRLFLDEWNNVGHAHLGLMWGAVRGRVTETDRKAGPYLIANPGVPVSWPSVPSGTLVVTHENDVAPGYTSPPKPWEAALCHSLDNPTATKATLITEGWQWGYCTSDGPDGNPYDNPTKGTP